MWGITGVYDWVNRMYTKKLSYKGSLLRPL